MNPGQIKTALEFAPSAHSIPMPAKNLRGWWLPSGYYLCATCANRIAARGVILPGKSRAVWADRPEPYGICEGCEK